VGGALDTITRTIPVRAVVKNTDGRLRPAMFATALIDGGAMRAVVVLPSDAVQMLDNRSVVFVARPDGKGGATFERRDVETESSTGARTEVVRGLAAGDLVVTTGAFAIKSEFARAKMAGE
jgi:membrane fusion protein, heavy metal efflux system